MVVRFDLEDRGETVADVDGARILPGSLKDARAGRRQRFQMHARALVAAVLRPHHREDAELRQRRLALQRVDNPLIFLPGEAVAFENVVAMVIGCGDRLRRRFGAQEGALADHLHRGFEHDQAVRTAKRHLARALRMRHQADDVALFVAEAGDVGDRSVWVRLVGRHTLLRSYNER